MWTMKSVSHAPNAFGFLRLLFASLVIVSHAPELADGNRGRELLTQLFGSLSFGEVAVAGFFIVSGYLITGSYQSSRNTSSYLVKRVARIYPAFIVTSLLCIVVVAPLAGGELSLTLRSVLISTFRMVLLQPPDVAGSFAGTPQPYLDGAMWTIAHEFRCYLLVMALGATGLLDRRWLAPIIAVVLLAVAAEVPKDVSDAINARMYHPELWFGSVIDACRLPGLFLSGASFYLFRDRIRYTALGIAAAATGVVVGLNIPPIASIALAGFGAYLIIGVAEHANTEWMRRVNSRDDISYGVYLYAWPITKLLLLYYPRMPIAAVAMYTFILAVLCGWASWRWIEKPVMERVRTRPGFVGMMMMGRPSWRKS